MLTLFTMESMHNSTSDHSLYGGNRSILLKSIVPEANATLPAEEQRQNLGTVGEKAALEEKHRPISCIFEAVYVAMVASRSIIWIQPKPSFSPIFDALKNQAGNKIIVFNGRPVESTKTSTVMVEMGEFQTSFKACR